MPSPHLPRWSPLPPQRWPGPLPQACRPQWSLTTPWRHSAGSTSQLPPSHGGHSGLAATLVGPAAKSSARATTAASSSSGDDSEAVAAGARMAGTRLSAAAEEAAEQATSAAGGSLRAPGGRAALLIGDASRVASHAGSLASLTGTAWQAAAPVRRLVKRVFRPVDRLEQSYLRMTNISFMVNQMMFFMVCERLLLDDCRVAGLYSLMFYNVTAYCVAYIKELIHKEDWSPYVTITEHSNVKHLAMSATKIVLEWTKAVTFIITVVFMLLVFGLEQGLQHYKPTFTYTVITALFYMCTEKVFSESFPALLLWLQPPALEGLEALWAPVLLRAASVAMSAAATLALLWRQPLLWRGPVAALYFNVWLRGRETAVNSFRALSAERAAVSRFRFATEEELQEYEDVCAVCLSPMKRARVTPCQHLFHGDCLRQCLQRSDHCPICKRELRFY